jgi:hypothetical protein
MLQEQLFSHRALRSSKESLICWLYAYAVQRIFKQVVSYFHAFDAMTLVVSWMIHAFDAMTLVVSWMIHRLGMCEL